MKTIGKKLLLASVLPLAMVVSAPANALDFYYDAYGGFTDPAEVSPTPPIGFPGSSHYDVLNTFDTDVTTWQHFGWGTPVGNEESHLTINEIDPSNPAHDPSNYNDHINSSVTVSDPLGSLLGTLTHHNFPILAGTGPNPPGSLAVHYHLDLFSDAAKTASVFESGAMDFTLEMWETPNGDNPCANGEANNQGVNINGCADRLQYAAGWQVTPTAGFLDQQVGSFIYDGLKYGVSVAGFYGMDISGALVEQDYFWTAEGFATTAFVQFEVHEVPEPGTMVLMGLGLAGLSFATRRRIKEAAMVA